MKIAIISAMEQELEPIITYHKPDRINKLNGQDVYSYTTKNNEFYLLNSGIGKINATLTTSLLINEYNPELIINIGTSGGLHKDLKVGDAVIATKMSFHDVDVSGFGYEIGQIPGNERYLDVKENKILDEIVSSLFENTYHGLVVSGDQFIDNKESKEQIISNFEDVYAVEMESAAILYTANKLNTDIYIVRTISDLAHETSSVEFDEYLEIVSAKFAKLVELIDG